MSRVLESDETGSLTIPADLLGNSSAHSRYLVENDGQTIHIHLESIRVGHAERMRRWRDLADRIGTSSSTERSAVEILSEMRR